MQTFDSNGNELADGDNVTLIKDLKVKGTSTTLKRGTMVKSIRLTNDEGEVECRIGKTTIVLKTQFLKKSN
ncbi:alkylphosphonate utilization protein [Kordiimonas pumila]|uniref:Alkylphosphonate utilization protein n=1 Tax=Kordiimonas pumila TaxID=2161677 RepID=A0ABV7D0J6_9PROT|nr:alkylphosphonate utilization protein [Kordiimonas pumila]